MNIVQVPRRFVREEWGGTETVVLETSRRLAEHGHHTEIICPNALASVNHENIGGIPIQRVPYFYPYFGLRRGAREKMDKKGGNMFSFALMAELMRRPDLDCLHLHTQKRIGGIGRYVARRRGIPYVVSLHGGIYDVPIEESARWTEPSQGAFEWGKALGWWVGSNRVLADADAILCVGDAERRETQARFPDRRVEWLPNGVDCHRFSHGDGPAFRHRFGIPQSAFVVLCAGRIDPQKNQRLLLEAFPALLAEQPDAHLVLAGHVTNPDYLIEISELAEMLGVKPRLTLIPGLDVSGPDVVNAYHAADLFVLPSVHEPFGIVVLEAWAAGKPVVASRVGGIPSFTTHNTDIYLFESGNHQELAVALIALSRDPARRHALAQSGQVKALASFDWDHVTARLEGIYCDVLQARTRATKHS